MDSCQIPKPDMFPNPVFVTVDDTGLDFQKAETIAKDKAGSRYNDALLLSWYDRKREFYSPQVECCSEESPSWVVYAVSRGGNLTIDINNEEYVFIFRGDDDTKA